MKGARTATLASLAAAAPHARSALLATLAAIAWCARPATAQIFECVDAAGNTTFVNHPDACPDAKPHELKGRVERASSSAGPAAEELPDPSRLGSPEARLEWALLDEGQVRPRWEIVNEVPEDAREDVDLVEWGVVAKRARHYTRSSAGAPQVCSVELWAFENDARARLAHENFQFPDWRIDQLGDTLVMLRAVTLRGGEAERAIYADCEALGELVRARAAKLAAVGSAPARTQR